MFDHAGGQFDRGQRRVADDLDTLDVALGKAGFVPPSRYGVARDAVCGTMYRVSVRNVVESSVAGVALLQKLSNLTDSKIPVNLSVEDFPVEESTVTVWQRFCEALRDALSPCKLPGNSPGLCVHSHQMPQEAFCLIADAVLGRGPRYVFLDSLQMTAHCNRAVDERAASNWSFLWRQRATARPVMPVYGGFVRSACPLLADEVATTVVPGMGLNAPARSAWLPLTLPITRFATRTGRLRWPELVDAISEAISIVEQMHDRVSWHEKAQARDARENRRVALNVIELGDIVRRRGDDPANLSCQRWLAGVVNRLRNELQTQSRNIAARTGPVPALQEANHVGQWRAGPQRESWCRHWDEALRQSAVRHRNLLVISPYAVIPSEGSATAAYSDLLPVIGVADAWNFSAPPDFSGWNAAQYRQFHRRARAVIQGSHTASFVAAGV